MFKRKTKLKLYENYNKKKLYLFLHLNDDNSMKIKN